MATEYVESIDILDGPPNLEALLANARRALECDDITWTLSERPDKLYVVQFRAVPAKAV